MKTLIVLLAVFFSADVFAAMPACPALLQTTVTAQPAEGYTAYADGNPPIKTNEVQKIAPLVRIAFSEGAPSQQRWLAPGDSSAKKLVWNFQASQDEDVWITCAYRDTSIVLAMPIGNEVTMCEVHQKKSLPPVLSCRGH
jgi:hypothetical protein